ncbi:Bifunctional inhibitor/lipid-transfer protein/seed storage 2S albumin superfamily protein [Rhynchospora pubera]|uniref:Bifunctional inhibitor/lipid-transfer protein/seed storage 2S albumin superfamily protein n=1 Tax=Rhynchospora pubera TaxID=906938 RepID=A0AAV8C6W8_9POAL|nr:Bifunctional inhibitor/lipid-transfer protein/seed storage 2S albumin superfamily protein [Rhynchospora pubera]
MAKTRTLSLLLFLNIIVIIMGADVPAPAPSVDCMPALLSLADCLTYVEQGSNLTKPEGDCCSGLKKVVKNEVHCLCEAFSGGSSLGIPLDINITKALALPSVCKVKTPPASKCKIPGAPNGAPAAAPGGALEGSPSPAMAGETTGAAPSPSKSTAAFVKAPQLKTIAGFAVTLLYQFIY